LQGGRYCSIKGVTAAQLRFASESDGKVSTLYQVPYEKALFGSVPAIESDDSPMVLASKGLNVQLWVEKGLLMVLVEENSDFSKYILKNHKN